MVLLTSCVLKFSKIERLVGGVRVYTGNHELDGYSEGLNTPSWLLGEITILSRKLQVAKNMLSLLLAIVYRY